MDGQRKFSTQKKLLGGDVVLFHYFDGRRYPGTVVNSVNPNKIRVAYQTERSLETSHVARTNLEFLFRPQYLGKKQ